MKSTKKITSEIVKKIATLANLPISDEEVEKLSGELSETLEYIEKIKAVKTDNIAPTSQVTGAENVYREDTVKSPLTQSVALSQAPKTNKGYFVTNAVLTE